MNPSTKDDDHPTLVCLHFLGGSARSWSGVAGRLAGRVTCLPLDLPGFGDAADVPGYSVAAMADDVAARIRGSGLGRWMIAGHSMGAKVAAVLARRAEDGAADLAGLRGLVLLAGSPPSPEPMEDSQRSAMLGWFTGAEAAWPERARDYIAANVAAPLDPAVHERAVADVLRMQPNAWMAWLRDGSREDWSERVGVLRIPALILCGADDANLGEDAQRRLMAPHFASHRLVKLPGVSHLLPLESPDEVAELIANHMQSDRTTQ
jgi:pimeloyl-ACP methyl ester carboxylesterase